MKALIIFLGKALEVVLYFVVSVAASSVVTLITLLVLYLSREVNKMPDNFLATFGNFQLIVYIFIPFLSIILLFLGYRKKNKKEFKEVLDSTVIVILIE